MGWLKRRSEHNTHATVSFSAAQLEEPFSDLAGHLRPDEMPLKSVPVGHMAQLAVLLVTDSRILWRFVQPGSPVLSLDFGDVWEVKTDGGLGVLLTYHPDRYPEQLRRVNPRGELDAEFIFQPGDEDVCQMVLDRADGAVQLRSAGATLASGMGYLEGVLRSERYKVDVEAHESKLVILLDGVPMATYPYNAIGWFRVGPLPAGLQASEHLGAGNQALWLSLTAADIEDRCRLIVQPDDLTRWETILEYFHITDNTETI